jgi:tetratricopeptide (TPR) repeat protein
VLGRSEEAIDALSRALALEPDRMSARYRMGWVQLQAGRRQDAARTWRPIIHAVSDPATLEQMVILYRQLGDREGEEAARRALGEPAPEPTGQR